MSVFESFRGARWARTVNLLLQAVLFVTLFYGLNHLARHPAWQEEPWRIDLTRDARFSLSPETLAYLKGLTAPIRIVVTQGEGTAPADLRGLLREYAYATEANPDGRIGVEYLDIDLHRRAAQQLGLDQPNVVVLISGEKRHTLTVDELYRSRGQLRQSFNGEASLTAAILVVSSPERKKIYFLVGHQELQPDDVDPVRGLSAARDQLRMRNFIVDTLDLAAARRIPDDASVLIAAAPGSPYGAREQELLRQYLSAREGRMIVLAAPGTRLGLDQLFGDWGIVLDDDLVHDPAPDSQTEDGDLIVRTFAPHPVTQGLLNASFQARLRVGAARSVRPDPARAAANGLDVTALAAASPTAWGEVNPAARRPTRFSPGVDLPPSSHGLGLAVASARAAARDNLPFSVRNGRLILIGSGDLFANARLAHAGGLDLLLGAVDWMVDRDRELNLRARPLERFQLSLSAHELQNLRYSLMFVVPGAAALLGLIVYWTRRS